MVRTIEARTTHAGTANGRRLSRAQSICPRRRRLLAAEPLELEGLGAIGYGILVAVRP